MALMASNVPYCLLLKERYRFKIFLKIYNFVQKNLGKLLKIQKHCGRCAARNLFDHEIETFSFVLLLQIKARFKR